MIDSVIVDGMIDSVIIGIIGMIGTIGIVDGIVDRTGSIDSIAIDTGTIIGDKNAVPTSITRNIYD